jgi:hypothetical protein
MYRNRSRTALGIIALVGMIGGLALVILGWISVVIALVECATPFTACGDITAYGAVPIGVGLFVVGAIAGVGYLVARSASYDTWFRAANPDAPLRDPDKDDTPLPQADWEVRSTE